MASSNDNGEGETPQVIFSTPSFGSNQPSSRDHAHSVLHRRRKSHSSHDGKHIQLPVLEREPRHSTANSIYHGSYSQTPRRSRGSLGTGSARPSVSLSHLESLLQDLDLDLETYGLEENRDGFFDASFFKPPMVDHENLMKDAEYTLPAAFKKKHPLDPKNFFPKQWHEIKGVIKAVGTTRAGIKLAKSFLAVFIAYILCLVPVIHQWLGRYSYIMVLSTIFNHPGRTVGSQLDGTILTITGTATGLGWGALALFVSDSTTVARRGYGGILAMFLILFMGIIAALRSYFIRLYQFVLCAGIAITYTVLADTSGTISWKKLFEYGIPWLFGQAISLLICCIVFPDAGARPLAVSLHSAFDVMQRGLIIPQPDNQALHRQLALTFVDLSQAHRDLALDVSITRFKPADIVILRNLMQAVIRSLLSLRTETQLFDVIPDDVYGTSCVQQPLQQPTTANEIVIDIDHNNDLRPFFRTKSQEQAVKLVSHKLGDSTAELLSCMRSSLACCDAVLMDMSGYRKYIGPPANVSSDILGVLTKMRKSMIEYDEAEDSLMRDPKIPSTYSDHPEMVELFLFVLPIRQAVTKVEALVVKINEMQQRKPGWKLHLPSYPFKKAIDRTNAQVRHDRGGVTAGHYFRSQTQLARTMKGMANVYKPLPRDHVSKGKEEPEEEIMRSDTVGKYEEEEDIAMDRKSNASKQQRFRYRLWVGLHRLQGFETRFALKVAVVTSLLSIPAWLDQSQGWFNENESWWAVVMVWIMMHPRVGGNFQDLVTRALMGVIGAVWGGLAYGADNGNPYVMAVFAAVYMLPMLYRFTQSSHPRSGIVGCVSFVVVSLGAKAADGLPSISKIAWTRGVAFVVGVVAAVVINWIIWPFVARHELRKALSAMMIYSSIIYRGVVAKYVYYEKGDEPGKEDIERSEMLEGRLREGFVRIRQLMALTRHEIRLRGPFNPLPYSALIDSCERFFEYLVSVRQSSLFFHPHYMDDDEQAAESLLAFRRDAVAAVLVNLYVLAGALRGDRKVPRYLPSAAAARSSLLRHMAILEASQSASLTAKKIDSVKEGRKWSQIYSYSYSQSLTGCVQQLEQLQKYTKEIVGEQGFDPVDAAEYEDLTKERVSAHGLLDGAQELEAERERRAL